MRIHIMLRRLILAMEIYGIVNMNRFRQRREEDKKDRIAGWDGIRSVVVRHHLRFRGCFNPNSEIEKEVAMRNLLRQ